MFIGLAVWLYRAPGIEHAWTRDDAPTLANDRWQRIVWQVRVSAAGDGETRVLLDGQEVLAARGATAADILAGCAACCRGRCAPPPPRTPQ